MPSSFPGDLDAWADKTASQTLAAAGHTAAHNDVADAVEKIEVKVGTGASPATGATSGQVLTKQSDGTTAWSVISTITGSLTLTATTLPSGGSAIKIAPVGVSVDGFPIEVERNDKAFPYKRCFYIAGTGAIFTNAMIVVSAKYETTGHIQGVSAISGGSDEGPMSAFSPDVNAPTVAIEGRPFSTMTGTAKNQSAIGLYDLSDVHGGATAYSNGYGKKKAIISGKGEMMWGDNLGVDPALNAIIKLTRDGTGGGLVFEAVANGAVALTAKGATGATEAPFEAYKGTTKVAQIDTLGYGGFRAGVVAGSSGFGRVADTVVSVIAPTAVDAALRLRGSVAYNADYLSVENSTGATIYHRINKNGYSITKKNAAPADAELNANEMAVWFDSTNGAAKLMVKAKQADGTVRTAAVALA